MGLIERDEMPERVQIGRWDTGTFAGPYDADMRNGRPDLETAIYVRADLHTGAVSPEGIARAVSAVTEDGWHEAYNLNPEDWHEVASRMVRAALGGQSADTQDELRESEARAEAAEARAEAAEARLRNVRDSRPMPNGA